jgi:hypothetical protein
VPAGHVVRFAHPLYSEVLRAELPVLTARGHSLDLAKAATATGAHQRDPLRVATWLLDGGEEVVARGTRRHDGGVAVRRVDVLRRRG